MFDKDKVKMLCDGLFEFIGYLWNSNVLKYKDYLRLIASVDSISQELDIYD